MKDVFLFVVCIVVAFSIAIFTVPTSATASTEKEDISIGTAALQDNGEHFMFIVDKDTGCHYIYTIATSKLDVRYDSNGKQLCQETTSDRPGNF